MWWHTVTHGRGSEWGNWRMQWVASTLHTTSEHGVSSITTAGAHTSAASSRLNWRPPGRFKWTRSVSRERRNLVSARGPSRFNWPLATDVLVTLHRASGISVWTVKVKKVKWSRYRPGVAQSVGRRIALLFHNRGTRRRWVVSSTPWPHLNPPERPGTHFTGGWVGPRAGLDGRKISSLPGFDPGPSIP